MFFSLCDGYITGEEGCVMCGMDAGGRDVEEPEMDRE